MYDLNGMTITMTAGDTAAFYVRPKYTFADGDKALFTVKNGNNVVVIRRWYSLDDTTESFLIVFQGQDTANLSPGTYRCTFDIISIRTMTRVGKSSEPTRRSRLIPRNSLS